MKKTSLVLDGLIRSFTNSSSVKVTLKKKNKPEMKVVDESKSMDAEDFNLNINDFKNV